MKANKIMLMATMALLASCSNEEELGQLSNGNLTLTATMESAINQSRVGFDATNGTLFWTEGDAFSVYTNNSTNPWANFTLIGTSGSSNGTFTGSLVGDNIKASQYAVYPNILNPSLSNGSLSVVMPTEYDYGTKSDSEFGQRGVSFNAPMLAQFDEFDATSTPNLSFKHLGGVFCFKLVNIPAGADKFVFSVNKAITGSHTVDLTDTSKPFIKTVTADTESATTNNEVTIKFTANETAATTRVFYIPVPTGTYGKFTWKVYDDTEEKSSFTSSETASNTVGRGTLVKMPTFTCASVNGTITTEVNSAETLSSALSAGNSVVLTEAITLSAKLEVKTDASIDLNGQNLNMGSNTIQVAEGTSLTLTNSGAATYSGRAVEETGITGTGDIITASANSKITIGEGVNLTTKGAGMCCIFVPGKDVNNIANDVTIESKGTLLTTQAGTATIYVNGNVSSGTINISGGSVKHDNDVAIYIAGKANLTISGDAEISGTTGIEIRAGKLNVTGGTITGTATEFEATPNKNGSTSKGAAIAITQHSTNHELGATISDGTFTGARALYEEDTCDDNVSEISMSVSGGTFNGEIYSENKQNFITKGTFSDASAFDYLAENADVTLGAEMNITTPIVISQNDVKLSLNEKNIISTVDAIEVNGGSLTIHGEGDVKAGIDGEKGSYCAVFAHDNATVNIEGGSYYVDGQDWNDCIYAKNGTTINIEGGTFESKNTKDNGNGLQHWVLNCRGEETNIAKSTIVVTGGTFINYNPANNVSEGSDTNYVADGYKVLVNGQETTEKHVAENEERTEYVVSK